MGNFDDIIQELTSLQEQGNTDFSTSIIDTPSSGIPYSETILEAKKAFGKNRVQANKNNTSNTLAEAKQYFTNVPRESGKLGMPRSDAYQYMIELADKALGNTNVSQGKQLDIRNKLDQFSKIHSDAAGNEPVGEVNSSGIRRTTGKLKSQQAVDDYVVQFVGELEELTKQSSFKTSELVEGFTPYLPAPSEQLAEIPTVKQPAISAEEPNVPFSEKIANEVKALKAIPRDTPVTEIKSTKISNTSAGLDLNEVTANKQVVDVLNEIGTNSRRLKPTTPIAEQFGSVARHTDNTWSVTTADGKTIPGLDEVTARAYQVYNEKYDEARKAGAPTSTITNKFYDYLKGWIDIGAWAANNVTGSTTLVERIHNHNADIAEKSIRLNTSYDRNASITPDDLDQYKAIKKATELSTDQLAFMESAKFNTIEELEGKALESKDEYDFIQRTAENLKEFIPSDNKEFHAARMAFKTLQKTEGNMAALGKAISEDLLTYIGQFPSSIPYMTVLTAGGPIAQSGIFYALAKGQSRKAIEEWVTKNGEENLTPEIVARIEAWNTVGLLFEKLSAGYVVKLLNKSLPLKAQLAWVTKVKDIVKLQTPDSIRTLTTLAGRFAGSIGVEAISGGGSELSKQMGDSGKITDPSEIVFGAFAEAAAIPGGMGGMVLQSQVAKAAKAALTNPAINNTATAEQQIIDLETKLNSNDPITFGDTAESEERQNDLKHANAALADIEKGQDSETFRKIYNDLIAGKTPHDEAIKLADEILNETLDAVLKDKKDLTKILTTPASATASADMKDRYQKTISILKDAVEEGDIDRKKAKDLGEQTKASIRGEKSPIEQNTFYLALDAIQNSVKIVKEELKIADVKRIFEDIEKLGNRELTDQQNKALAKVAQDFEFSVDVETKREDKPSSFSSLSNLGKVDDTELSKEISNSDITAVDLEVLENEKDSRASDKERKKLAKELENESKKTGDKGIAQVSKEIIQGKSRKWMGFDTYRTAIEEIFNDLTLDPVLRSVRIERQEELMNTHLSNLREKLEKFKTTQQLFLNSKPEPYTTPPSARYPNGQNMPAKVWVIYGHQEAGTGRLMSYTLPTKPISLRKYKTEKNKKNRVAFIIDGKSTKLIQTLEAEVQYGEDTIKVVQGHKNTSYFRINEQKKSKRIANSEVVSYLKKFRTTKLNKQTLLTEEDIEKSKIDSKAVPPAITKTAYSDKKEWPSVSILKAELDTFRKELKQLNEDILEENAISTPNQDKLSEKVNLRTDVEDSIKEIEAELKLRDGKGETAPPPTTTTSKLKELTEELEDGVRHALIQSLAAAKRDRDVGENAGERVRGKTDKELEQLYNEGIKKINDFIEIAKASKYPIEKIGKKLLSIKNNNPVLGYAGGFITSEKSFSRIIKAGKVRTSKIIQAEIAKLTKKDTPPPSPAPPSTPTSEEVTTKKGTFTRLNEDGETISVTGTVIKLGDRGILGVTKALDGIGFDVIRISTKSKVPFLNSIDEESKAIEAAKLVAPKVEIKGDKPTTDDVSLSVEFEGQESLEDFLKNLRDKVDTDPHFAKTDKEVGDFIINLLKTKPTGYKEDIQNAKAELTQRAKDKESKRKNRILNETTPISNESFRDAGEGTSTYRTQEQKENGVLTEGIISSFKDTADALQWLVENTINTSFKAIAQELQSKINSGIPITYINVFPDRKATEFSPKTPGENIAGQATYNPSNGKPLKIEIANLGLSERTLLHEITHHAVGTTYKNPKTLEEIAAVKQLKLIAKLVRDAANDENKIKEIKAAFKEKYPDRLDYQDSGRIKNYLKIIGEVKGEELITHGLTSVEAQLILQSVKGLRDPYIKSNESLWESFTKTIRTLLNIPDNVQVTLFDQVLEASAVFISNKNKADKRYLAKESYSKQSFRALFPEIITPKGELVSEEELGKYSGLLDKLAAQLNVSVVGEDEKIGDKSKLIEGVTSILEKLPQSVNFIEGSSVKFPATVTEKELKDDINKRKSLDGLKGNERKLKIKELYAINQENILGLLGKRFSELVGMRPDSRGIHTIPDEAFLPENSKILIQALVDLMTNPVYAEGQELLASLALDKTKINEIKKAASVLVDQYKTYKKRYDNIAYDLDSHTNPKINANFSIVSPLALLHKETQLPPQLIFMMMLGITTWRQYHKNNVAFLHKPHKEAFLYGSQEDLSVDEERELNNIKFNYKETTNDVGIMITSMAKMFARKDVQHADLYFSKLTPALGMVALQIEHGRFDKHTIDGKNYLNSDYSSAAYDSNSKIQIEVRTWTFDPPYVENRNYNNPINKDEAALLSNEKDDTGNKIFRKPVEINEGKYKHIRVNTDNKITKNESAALKLILEAINSNVDPEANFPLQEPAKVDRFIPHALGGVPNRVFGVIKDLQNNPSSANEAMVILAKIANSKYKDVLNTIIEIENLGDAEEQKKTHEAVRQSKQSSNEYKKNALSSILEAFNLGYLKKFFYSYRLQNQLRILQKGTINPQQNKIHRSLVKTYESLEYTDTNINLFKLAVTFNFGVKVDHQNFGESMRRFNDIIGDPNVQIAAKAIANIEDDKELVRLVGVLPLIQSKYNGGVSLFSGLTALSKYMPYGIPESPETKFTSDIIFETDAISSGHMINVLQFPQFHNKDGIDILEETLKKGGMSFGKTEEETNHDPSKPAAYDDLVEKITEYAGIDSAEEQESIDKYYFVPNNYEEKSSAINVLYPDMGNIKLLRDVVKYPFIMSIYGGGDVTIPEYVSKVIVKSLYVELDRLQKQYVSSAEEITTFEINLKKTKDKYVDYYKILGVNRKDDRDTIVHAFELIRINRKKDGEKLSKLERDAINTLRNEKQRKSYDAQITKADNSGVETIKVKGKKEFITNEVVPFIDNLTIIEAFNKSRGRQITDAKELVRSIAAINNEIGLSQNRYFNDSHLIHHMGLILRPRFSKGLSELLGGTKASRDAVVASAEILQAMFEIAYKEEKEKALIISEESIDKEGNVIPEIKRLSLTEKENNNLIKNELTKIFPQFKSPLANESDSYLNQVISLLNSIPGKTKNYMETTQYKFKNVNSSTNVAETSNRTSGFGLPGVAALIRMVQNIDASALTETLKTFPMLQPLHDSVMGRPDLLVNATTRYGNVIVKLNRDNNILTQIIEQVDRVIAENPGLKERANTWILENGYQNKIAKKEGMNPLSIDEIRNNNNKAQKENQVALNKLHDRADKEGFSAKNHMYMSSPTLEDIYDSKKPYSLNENDQTLYSELKKEAEDTIQKLIDTQKEPKIISSKKEVTKEETDNNIEFSSLSNLPRDNPAPINSLSGDLKSETIKATFEKLKKYSGDYYQSAKERDDHVSVLNDIFNLLAKGMDETTRITLNTEQIDGITFGGFTEEVNKLRMSISRRPPLAVNSQSPQEVYVHEIVHAMSSIALKESPLVAKRIEKLYHQIEKQLNNDYKGKGYQVFLAGINNPSVRDIVTAKKQYDFLFRNPDNEANKLHEFLSYAVTNKQLIDYLKTKSLNLPEREGIFGKLRHIVDTLVDIFIKLINKRFYSKYGSKYFLQNINAYHEMLAVTEQLVAIQSNHESILQKLQSKTYIGLSVTDKKIQKFGNDLYEELSIGGGSPLLGIHSDSEDGSIADKARKVTSLVAEVPRLALSDSALTLEKRNIAYRMLNKTLRSAADEQGGGVLSKPLIEQLLHSRVSISKARQLHERFATDWFNSIWKSVDATKDGELSVALREALTEVVFRTDLTSLLDINISNYDIVQLLDSKKLREKEKGAIEQNLKKTRGNRNKAVQYAKELGFFMGQGDRALPIPHMNAYTIAHKYLINPTKTDIAQLDAYATLVSLEYIDSRELQIVKGLATREFAKNATINGFTDLLQGHRVYKRSSLNGLFEGNPTQMVKGYIVGRIDNLTHIKTGTLADKEQMKKEGYHEAYKLGKIPGIPEVTQTIVYVTRIVPEVTDASGIMSTTNQRAMGTTLTEIYSKNSKFWHKTGDNKGKPDFSRIKATIKLVKQSEEKKSKDPKLKEDTSLKLSPVRDGNQNITDFRVMMNHANTKEILRPDLEIQNVFAHMNSGLVDRQNTIDSNKATIDILVHEQQDLFKTHENLFTDLLDPNSVYVERYRKLPKPIREYIKQYAVGNRFMVREDIIDKVFGYKVHDITQLEILQRPELARVKHVAGILHNIIRSIVSYGKNRIVIAMPQVIINNLLSNISQLTMRNIPLSYVMYKIAEGFQEYKRYEKDTNKLMKLEQKIAIRKLNRQTSEEGKEATRLKIRIEGNRIHRMSEAGVNSLIVEDINDAQIDGFFNQARRRLRVNHKHSKWSDEIIGRLPKKIGPWKASEVGAVLFMTKSSKPYQLAHHVVQLTDFLGRYVMIEHLVNVENMEFNTALHKSIDAFVLFDEALTPVLEALDAIGVTSFLSYYLRNNRSSRQLVQSNPTGVGLSAAFQYTTGVPSLGNVNSSWLGGDFSPNLLQFDELFDEANNMTGVDIVVDSVKSIFN